MLQQKSIRIGELRERLTLQTRRERVASDRQRIEEWIDCGTFWGKVSATSGDEIVESSSPRSETVWTVVTRYISLVTQAGSRWMWRGRTLAIENVIVDEKRRFMSMRCVERR